MLDLKKTQVPLIDESNIKGTWMANTMLRVEVLKTGKTELDITVGTLGETLPPNSTVDLGKIDRSNIPPIIE